MSNYTVFKKKLPLPFSVLEKLNFQTGRINKQGYIVIKCPFHKNGFERTPSLNIHQIDGHYLCHACNKKGSSILEFYMAYTGATFYEACRELRIDGGY